MARKSKRHLSFCKILFSSNFTRQLKLPRDFARENSRILPENAKLKTCSGKTWDVKMAKIDGENIYFSIGWAKFVKDMELEALDFLVFNWFSGKSTFQVSCFGKNGCDKEPPGFIYGENESEKRTMCAVKKEANSFTDGVARSDNSNPRFEIILKEHQRSRVCIPKRFAVVCGLMGERRVCVDYFPRGHRVYVDLDLRPNGSLQLALGWSKFRKENELALGEAYMFEFIPSTRVLQVKHNE